MTVTPNMGIDKPIVGGSQGTWGPKVNAALDRVDAHNHTAGSGVRIPTAALNIDADISFSGSWAPTHLHRISFDGAAIGSNNKSIFVSDGSGGLVANELYWRTNGGTNVRLTNGTALNVAAFTGGIGGDYSTIGALVDYDDATDTYRMRQETASAVRQYAKVACADLKLTEYKASGVTPVPSNSVTLKSPAALAASYSVTWPGAVPSATRPVQMSSAGVLTAGDADNVQVGGTLGVTGAATLSSTLGVTGLITATAGITAAANQHVTVSGTGAFKYGTQTLPIPAAAFNPAAGVTITLNAGSITFGITTNPAAYAPIMIPVGIRVTAIRVFIQDNATGPSTLTATFSSVGTTGTVTDIASSSASAGNGTNQTLTIGSLTTTIAASTSYRIKITETSGSGSTCTVYMAEVDYDRP